jgi:hypothetical protein
MSALSNKEEKLMKGSRPDLMNLPGPFASMMSPANTIDMFSLALALTLQAKKITNAIMKIIRILFTAY